MNGKKRPISAPTRQALATAGITYVGGRYEPGGLRWLFELSDGTETGVFTPTPRGGLTTKVVARAGEFAARTMLREAEAR